MPKYFGYLRVSTDGQEVESQKLGLLEYANRQGFAPMELIAETVSRAADWRSRQLGALLERAGQGDVILTPEFTRLAATPGQVFTFLEAATAKGVILHVTKTGTVMDGSMQSQLLASVFSMASLIELSFIRERTKEGLRRAKRAATRRGRAVEAGRARGRNQGLHRYRAAQAEDGEGAWRGVQHIGAFHRKKRACDKQKRLTQCASSITLES